MQTALMQVEIKAARTNAGGVQAERLCGMLGLRAWKLQLPGQSREPRVPHRGRIELVGAERAIVLQIGSPYFKGTTCFWM